VRPALASPVSARYYRRSLAIRLVTGTAPARVVKKFLDDQAPNWAIIIAWNGLLAMFPIVLVAAALLGVVLQLAGITTAQIYAKLLSLIPTDASTAAELTRALNGVKEQTGLLAVVGLVGLVWGGSALFGAMEQAFSIVYHVKPRDFIRGKLMSIAMVILFTLLAGIDVFTSSVLPALKDLPNLPTVLAGDANVGLPVLIGVTAGFALFAVIYFAVPNTKLRLRQVWPGALVAGILFELVTLLFPAYVALNKGLNTYGKAFGLFFLLTTFFYFLGLITMVGVEVNSVLYPAHAGQPVRGLPDPQAMPAPTAPPPARRALRAGLAIVLAAVASGIGLFIGRRTVTKN
jgi:membrane protein